MYCSSDSKGIESIRGEIIDDCAFTAANADLRRHLDIVRGRHPRTFSYLLNRPIRIETPGGGGWGSEKAEPVPAGPLAGR